MQNPQAPRATRKAVTEYVTPSRWEPAWLGGPLRVEDTGNGKPRGMCIRDDASLHGVRQVKPGSTQARIWQELTKVMTSCVRYPPHKMQSYGYTGPITLSAYERFRWIRDQLEKEGVHVALPTGNWAQQNVKLRSGNAIRIAFPVLSTVEPSLRAQRICIGKYSVNGKGDFATTSITVALGDRC